MNTYEIFEKENEGAFYSPIREFYVLAGKGGAAFITKSQKYYMVTKTIAALFDPEENKLINKNMVMRWPVSIKEYTEDTKKTYFNKYQEGQLYKITGAFYHNPLGKIPFFYVKTAERVEKTGTILDESQKRYWEPITKEDEVLGLLTLDKSQGEFHGEVVYGDSSVEIYAIVEWDDKSTWKKPLGVARGFVTNIQENDEKTRKFIGEDFFASEDFREDIEYYSKEIGVEPIDSADKLIDFLKGNLKYIYVYPDGDYTIAYDDGDLFGGHEIMVSVNADGEFDNVDIVG